MSAPSPLSGFSRITLSAPTTRADVAVPNSVPVAAFLPVLLDQVGQDSQVTVPGHGGWQLHRLDGRSIDLGRSMDSNEVRDGDVLVLQPARSVVDTPLFDDVVEVISRDSVRDRWTGRERRTASALIGGLAVLAALGALLRLSDTHRLLVAGICAAAAVLLLLGGLAVSRAAGDLPGGGVVAALAGPYGAVAAPLFVAGPWDRSRLLLACAALLVVAAVLPAVVGGFEAVSGAYGLLAAFGALGSLITVVGDVHAVRAVAVVAPLALATTTLLPAASLRLARLPRPQVASTVPELAELPGEIDQQRTASRVRSARVLLAGLTTGALGVTALGAVVLIDRGDTWGRALAGVLVALVFLRSRLFAARTPVVVGVAIASLASLAMIVVAVARFATTGLIVAAGTSGALAVVALVVGATAGRWEATPRQRRLLDTLETLLLLSVPPLVLGVWQVYSAVYDLGR